MAKKQKRRRKDVQPKIQEATPASPVGPVMHPDVGEGFEMPEPGPITPGEMARVHRAMQEEIDKRGLGTIDDINAFLNEHFCGRPIDDILEGRDLTPEEEARQILDSLGEAENLEEALEFCRKAIERSPDAIEARAFIALSTSESHEEAILGLKTAIAVHEKYWGGDYIEENKGYFWGLMETRPYMGVRAQLVELLVDGGYEELAIREIEEMLELNPNDNQGMRDILRGLYLAVNRLDDLKKLNRQFDESMLATCAWSKAFAYCLENNVKQAEAAARKAHKANCFVLDFLTGREEPPDEDPPYYSIGSYEEAVICYRMLSPFLFYIDVSEWLESVKGLAGAPATKRAKPKKKKKTHTNSH